jgi:hypothetical protein
MLKHFFRYNEHNPHVSTVILPNQSKVMTGTKDLNQLSPIVVVVRGHDI